MVLSMSYNVFRAVPEYRLGDTSTVYHHLYAHSFSVLLASALRVSAVSDSYKITGIET